MYSLPEKCVIMYTKNNISIKIIIKEEWKHSVLFFVYGVAIYLLYYHFQEGLFKISFLPIGTLGTAVAFLLGFKNNIAYDRWWEGRKIWGGIINVSRTLGTQVLTYIQNEEATTLIDSSHKKIIYRHLAYVNSLRFQLRKQDCWNDIRDFLSEDDYNSLLNKTNKATHLNLLQTRNFERLRRENKIEDFRLFELMHSIEKLYDFQGRAERIKSTPLLRHYSFFTSAFVRLFILLLPFGFIGEDINWVGLPLFFVVATIFNMIDKSGTLTENPFENGFNDVPLTALCNTIEIDLKEMLEEDNIPLKLYPEDNIIM